MRTCGLRLTATFVLVVPLAVFVKPRNRRRAVPRRSRYPWHPHRPFSWRRMQPRRPPFPLTPPRPKQPSSSRKSMATNMPRPRPQREKQALAKKLLGKANESKDDPAGQFVLVETCQGHRYAGKRWADGVSGD